MSEQTHESELSRRKFLSKAGLLTACFVATGVAGYSGIANATTTPAGNGQLPVSPASPLGPLAVAANPLPWKYAKLDVDLVRKRGYEGYLAGGCCYGAAYALLTTLHEGTPDAGWDSIPQKMFSYGSGGALSWGTLCGALNSSLAVMTLASSKSSDLGNELMGWYTLFPFPSKNHEAYCAIPNQVTTVADSPLCHVSVSKWSAAAGADGRVNQAGKKDRCAKVTGDTAARTAELLNQALEGKFASTYKTPDDFAHCMGCHNGKDSVMDNEQGKMNCNSCHFTY